jgi:serine/threonine protein kinase/tetratricopeptide (TPR) repeat protein
MLEAGTRLGPYEILASIGAGGMGEVYRARDTRLSRDVALKLLPQTVARDPARVARFERETKALAALSHPNLLVIHDVGQEGDLAYAATELLEGETLRQRITREQLPWRKAVEIAAAIAEGLACAHEHAIVHRDVKPENVFLTTDGRVKVLDFGLARVGVAGPGSDSDLPTLTSPSPPTRTGAIMGTIGYMSPEQVKGQVAHHPCDLFALGLVLHEMLAGKRAFARETAAETMTAILREPAPELHLTGSDAPFEIARIVSHCLEKAPGERFQSARDLAFALRTVLTASGPVHPVPGLAALDERPSIAVLPFANLSADPEQEYLCDGVAEEVTADLSGVSSLRVISRTSTIRMKGTQKDAHTIGHELGVRYVLEGSVRRAGNRLRITAQLVDTHEDAHLWAHKYDGALDDVFDIQERVARSVVEALRLKLSVSEEHRIAERPIQDVRAFECYLRARQDLYLLSEESLDRGLRLLENGLAIAGENELLYSVMGNIYLQYVNSLIKPRQTYLQSAEECARKIIALAPTSPHGRWLQGALRHKYGDVQGAVWLLKQAVAIDPNHPDALYWLSYAYRVSGQELAARPLVERLVSIDPLTPYSYWAAGWIDFFGGNIAHALRLFTRMYELDPQSAFSRWGYAFALATSGRRDEAQSILEVLVRETPRTFHGRHGRFLALAFGGDRPGALAAMTEDLEGEVRLDEHVSWMTATAFAVTGEKAAALAWLQNAVRLGFINYPYLSKQVALLEVLEGEEGFEPLMVEVKKRWEDFKV